MWYAGGIIMDTLVLTKLVRQARDAATSGKGTSVVVDAINEIEDYISEPEPKTMEEAMKQMQMHHDIYNAKQEQFLGMLQEMERNV